jgi:uncharacterized protein (TIGR02594 family)
MFNLRSAALALAAAVICVLPAKAATHRPHRVPANIVRIDCDQRGCHEVRIGQKRAKASPRHRAARPAQAPRRHARAAAPRYTPSPQPAGYPALVYEARRWLGAGAVFGRATLWCGRFMSTIVRATGGRVPRDADMARSWANLPRVGGEVGAVAVLNRPGGGHVGVVTGFDRRGNPIIISGNHGRRVAEAVYPAARVYAYVRP